MVRRSRFYIYMAVALNIVTFWGFSQTYFSMFLTGQSLFGATVADMPFIVHLHGWTFFAWYLLLLWQASLIYTSNRSLHRTTGGLSIVLAVAMTVTGLIIIPINVFNESGAGGPPIWTLFGPTILSTLFLFVGFYVFALRNRKQADKHKRYIILASAPVLGAAVFRVLLTTLGPNLLNIPAGIILTNVFIVAAMLHDRHVDGRVHPTYWIGLGTCLAVEIVTLALPHTPIGNLIHSALSAIGERLLFLYT